MTPQEMRARIAAQEAAAGGEEEQCCGTTKEGDDDNFEALDMDEFFEACELLSNCRDMFKRMLKGSHLSTHLRRSVDQM
mgnify:FL=1